MGIEFLARAAGVLLADLPEIMLRQMCQHVLPVLEAGLAFRATVSDHVVPVVGLQMPGQMLPEGLEVLQGCPALPAQQRARCVTVLRGRGMFARQVCWLRRCLISGQLTPRHLRIVAAVHFGLRVLSAVQRTDASVLAVLKNVVLGVRSRRGTWYTAEGAHH